MSPNTVELLRGLAVLPLLLAWVVAAHIGSSGETPSHFDAALGVSPLVLAAGLLIRRIPSIAVQLGLALAGAVLLFWLWPHLRSNVAALYYLQHLGAHLTLGVVFGRTLFGAGEPLITRIARVMQPGGQISERQRHFTRQVTMAWTAFFFGNALLSTLLFIFAPVAVWSVHANLLTGPLLGLMFLIEYLVRRRVLPPEERPGFMAAIRAYRSNTSQTKSQP